MIVGHEYGWSAVSREPMDWTEYHLARQLLTDLGPGRALRAAQRAIDAEEDAALAALQKTVPRG